MKDKLTTKMPKNFVLKIPRNENAPLGILIPKKLYQKLKKAKSILVDN